MNSEEARQVALYPLAAPGTVIAAQDDLAAVLFDVRGDRGARRVEVSRISGCVSFTDERQLWAGNSRNPGSPVQVRRAAERHLETLRVHLDRENRRRAGSARMTPLPAVIPPEPRPPSPR